MEEGKDAGRRRQPWRCSPAHDAEWVPAVDSDGGGVDGTVRTTVNATASMARLGTATSGGRSDGGGSGEEGDGARVVEGTGAGGCKTKKREEEAGTLYIDPRGSIVAGMAAISPAKCGEVGRRERRDSNFRIPGVSSADAGGKEREWVRGLRRKVVTWATWPERRESEGDGGCGIRRRRPEVGDGPNRWAPPVGDLKGGGRRPAQLGRGLRPAQRGGERERMGRRPIRKRKRREKKKKKKEMNFLGLNIACARF
uniref:Uncharacterized protein n=1 Tax=Oryza sativa subsp. japonica TaxID=39947 RepID=Q6K2H0_ORYSJ|nr:hypothetical protein [Oryza sativa Japonica Group]BAD23646.1 hypothetical protein [Oryza sativa Japonica Group]